MGYYLVGNEKFYNKTPALLKSFRTRRKPIWVFNDNVYSAIDWRVPIAQDLFDLYRQRAQQLRDQYDYLVLYFSGGADSMNILHAFIDNGIFLDEIVMQMPKPVEDKCNPDDHSNGNFYSEIMFSAMPHLKKHADKIDPRTKIRLQDLAPATLEILRTDNWYESFPICGNIGVSSLGRQMLRYQDPHILELCQRGKYVGEIVGVDKPNVTFENQNYYAFFMDLSAYHYSVPVDYTASDIFNNFYRTEFFYWTPDMPEIVVKQAQMIKQAAELNPLIKQSLSESRNLHITEFRDVLHPIIYPPHVEVEWRTEKPGSHILRPMENWFWSLADEKTKQNYLQVIEYLKQNIDANQTIDGDLFSGIKAHVTQRYLL